MSEYPEKFRIPNDKIPRPWSQGCYDCCVMASVVKVLEVINYVKTGKYISLSKGYAYGRHSNPNFKNFKYGGGGDFDYTMNSILQRGSVPEEMYPKMNEIPNIIEDVENVPNLAELDKEAEKTKIKSFTKIPGDGYFKENVKKYLYEKQMPLVGNMTGKSHCTVIVGWNEKGFEFCDHDGRVDVETGRSWIYGGGKFNTAYYLDGGIEDYKEEDHMSNNKNGVENKKMPFIDVTENDWHYKYIEKLYNEQIMQGVSSDKFAPDKTLTRAEMAAILCRALYDME